MTQCYILIDQMIHSQIHDNLASILYLRHQLYSKDSHIEERYYWSNHWSVVQCPQYFRSPKSCFAEY